MTDLWSIDMLVQATKALQEEIAGRHAQEHSRAVSCLSGCNHCCHWPNAISVMEGLVLVDWLNQSRLWTKALRDKVSASADTVTGLTYDVWRCAMVPCPMLLADGTCLAWSARPVTCRLVASIGDPDWCHPHKVTEARGILPMASDLIMFRLRETAMLKPHGVKMITLPLATAMVVADRIRHDKLPVNSLSSVVFIEYARRLH